MDSLKGASMLPVSYPTLVRPHAVRDDPSPGGPEVHRGRSWRTPALVAMLAFTALATACQPAAEPGDVSPVGSVVESLPPDGGSTASSALPACVDVGTPVEPPAEFPREFPFPPGSVLTSARPTAGGGVYVAGYTPGTLQEVTRFFLDALPKAGFEHGIGDSEPWEAESDFTGHGYEGHWLIATLADCPGALGMAVATYRP